ncbi:MAG: excinuclease ABC subunit UvrC [Patescibacteria group bacterium]
MSTKPGIYLFLGKEGDLLYIGKAKNLRNRVLSYFKNNIELGPKTQILVSQIAKIKTIEVSSEIEALLLESRYIKKLRPKYNIRLMDGKAYPLIRITAKDKYPKVLISRRSDDKKSIYFGPFPNSSAVTLVLKTIRKIFPYQSVMNHPKKICLYNHLGLCPCPEVLKDRNYKKDVYRIVTFLNGNTKKVIKDLEKERNRLSKLELFEEAEKLQKKIDAIKYVTSPSYKNFDFIINPNLDSDIRDDELTQLKAILLKHKVKVKNLSRIECYDISNISGSNATGSMVVFVSGQKDSSQYRKFRIRNLPNFPASPAGRPNLPNDFAMMQQVISRRLIHSEWSFPDLIIVDGGKGQVSAALTALKDYGRKASNLTMKQFNNEAIAIPVIGLAKREETIVIPLPRHSGSSAALSRFGLSSRPVEGSLPKGSPRVYNFSEVSLPKDSEALKLLMRIRDEAHRFAISYHRKLRSSSFLS